MQQIPSDELQAMRERVDDWRTNHYYCDVSRLLDAYETALKEVELKDSEYQSLIKKHNEYARLIHTHGPEGRNYTNEQYARLRLENERLRKELKRIANTPKLSNVPSALHEVIDIACAALAGDPECTSV